ncbi:MAG: 16S rRNA methyltransferase [Chloroflexi bacterium]|nr:16S rRNA methyltransferase [Chloroflexota bacterium]
MGNAEKLDALVTAVTSSPKYRHISPDLARRVGERELAAQRNLKTAVKATKNKLHQVGGAYFEAKLDYAGMLAQLRATAVSPDAFRQTCHDLMRRHASTRERLPVLADFYATLAALPDIRVVVDVACGLNPLARAWMPFDDAIEYIAYDIYADMIGFIQAFMALAGINGSAQTRDIVSQPPTEPADLVMILKTLPVLEQIEKGAASRLLDSLNARYALITFPVRSLGGRGKGMIQTYERQFSAWVDSRNWQIQRFEFPSELAFLIQTRQ